MIRLPFMQTTDAPQEMNIEHRTSNTEHRMKTQARGGTLRRSTFDVRRSMFSRHLQARAFTLVEMLLVLVILAVLAAIVIPKFSGRSQQAKETAAKSQISSIELALDAYEVDTGSYPQGSLDALLEQPGNVQNWKGPYLKKGVPPDPWGNAYAYTFPGKRNANGYDLMSMGPDGRTPPNPHDDT